MKITVTLSDLLRKVSGLKKPLQISADSPSECLNVVVSQFPELKRWLYDDNEQLKPQIWLTLNGERIYEDEYGTSLKDGDEISIMLAILGG